jgi:hypothetical protein
MPKKNPTIGFMTILPPSHSHNTPDTSADMLTQILKRPEALATKRKGDTSNTIVAILNKGKKRKVLDNRHPTHLHQHVFKYGGILTTNQLTCNHWCVRVDGGEGEKGVVSAEVSTELVRSVDGLVVLTDSFQASEAAGMLRDILQVLREKRVEIPVLVYASGQEEAGALSTEKIVAALGGLDNLKLPPHFFVQPFSLDDGVVSGWKWLQEALFESPASNTLRCQKVPGDYDTFSNASLRRRPSRLKLYLLKNMATVDEATFRRVAVAYGVDVRRLYTRDISIHTSDYALATQEQLLRSINKTRWWQEVVKMISTASFFAFIAGIAAQVAVNDDALLRINPLTHLYKFILNYAAATFPDSHEHRELFMQMAGFLIPAAFLLTISASSNQRLARIHKLLDKQLQDGIKPTRRPYDGHSLKKKHRKAHDIMVNAKLKKKNMVHVRNELLLGLSNRELSAKHLIRSDGTERQSMGEVADAIVHHSPMQRLFGINRQYADIPPSSPSRSGTPSGSVAPSRSGTPSGSVAPSRSGTPSGSVAPSRSGTPSGSVAPSRSGTSSSTVRRTRSGNPSSSVHTPSRTVRRTRSGNPSSSVHTPSRTVRRTRSGNPSSSVRRTRSDNPSSSVGPQKAPVSPRSGNRHECD